jgi:hypothetical protein
MTARQLSKRLDGFDVQRTTFRTGTTTAKGYRSEDFTEAFKRYLPEKGVKIGNTVTSLIYKDIIGDLSVTTPSPVTDKNQHKSLINNTCYRVTDKSNTPEEGSEKHEPVTDCGNGNGTRTNTTTTQNHPPDSRHFGQSLQHEPLAKPAENTLQQQWSIEL